MTRNMAMGRSMSGPSAEMILNQFRRKRNRCARFRRRARAVATMATIILNLWVMDGPGRAAETPTLSEYQVKALFLFNFAKYVDWPSSAFPKDDSPIVIGLVGQDSFGDDFQQVIAGKSINGRSVVIKHLVDPAEFKSCHILFISASEKERVSEILNVVKDSAVLTVGETEGFLAQEGMINFTKKANKVRLEINLAAAERANLKLSSKLLSVADVVLGKTEEKKK